MVVLKIKIEREMEVNNVDVAIEQKKRCRQKKYCTRNPGSSHQL
jgi:hypothetical protein